jgi:hypothetical protein
MVGTLTLRAYGKAAESFRVSDATVTVEKVGDAFHWHFAVETGSKTWENPRAELTAIASTDEPEEFLSGLVTLPTSYSKERGDYLATLYFHEEEDLDGNVIECTRRYPDRFDLRWKGYSGDYELNVEAQFRFDRTPAGQPTGRPIW